jgi:hypothetical protein
LERERGQCRKDHPEQRLSFRIQRYVSSENDVMACMPAYGRACVFVREL